MSNNERKRNSYRKTVIEALQRILNDSSVMPNSDCADLVVFVKDVKFGRTVREIFVDVWGEPRNQNRDCKHDLYLKEAEANGNLTYLDLTDMFIDPDLTAIIADELRANLKLQYTPKIRRIDD